MVGELWCNMKEKAQLSHSLGNFCLEDDQHMGQQKKIKSFCLGTNFDI
jgi:hypothetical protein